MPMETPEESWAGDLFDRQAEAADVIGYLESVAQRPQIRDEGHAHVLAVDTSYGQGKSFFLRRLARDMAREHAVAFVDAWVDDLDDEPMVALAATLDKALEPWVERTPKLDARMAEFRAKAGRVAKIVGTGLAKRAASFVIMSSGAELLGDELSKAGDTAKDLIKENLKDAGNEVIDNAIAGFGTQMAPSMEARIARFRDGQQAITDMKSGLAAIVDALVEAEMRLPITIVIDELDRCRPTYAIKVLEEVKHLFDVPGVAFVLGLHGQQLAHSVTAAYGIGFDAQAYLRRFFHRRYILKEAPLERLLQKLAADLQIDLARLRSPRVAPAGQTRSAEELSPTKLIARYMRMYGLQARDAFQVMEMLQTSMALAGTGPILVPLFLPMIIAHILDEDVGKLKQTNPISWVFVTYDHSDRDSAPEESSPQKLLNEMHGAAAMDRRGLMQTYNDRSASPGVTWVAEITFAGNGNDQPHFPANYQRLLSAVQRFKSTSE